MLKKKHTKQKIAAVILLVMILLTLWFADRLLTLKTEHGIMQARAMYAQPKNTIDVVMMGSSHIHCDINTAYLWEKYGIAAYDYSAAEQPLWITYHYLKEICKYQTPKLVVLDLYSPARFKDDHQYLWLPDNLLGMRFSLNKLQTLAAASEPSRMFEFFPSLSYYHNRYKELTPEDYDGAFQSSKELASYKGYTPYFNVNYQIEPDFYNEDSGGITIKSEEYLQKIMKFTKEHGIELFLIVSPYITTYEDETVYNRIHEIAEANGLHFNSTNYAYDEIGLDFATDFNDESHLNYLGSCKFSDYLGGQIKEKYDVPDRRGDARYESWDRHAAAINAYVMDVARQQQEAAAAAGQTE